MKLKNDHTLTFVFWIKENIQESNDHGVILSIVAHANQILFPELAFFLSVVHAILPPMCHQTMPCWIIKKKKQIWYASLLDLIENATF